MLGTGGQKVKNFNAEEVKEALERCTSPDRNCDCGYDCSYGDLISCTQLLMANALALINSQEQRIGELAQANEQLSESYDHLEKTKDELLSERSRLTEENERLKAQKYYIHSDGRIEMIPTVESVRADTVKKMHFEIQQRCIKGGIYPLFVGYTLDQVAYEITGDDFFKPRFMLECKE